MVTWTLWTNLAIQLITFGTSILTARILGPTGRGELALVLLYPQLVAGIAFLGVDRAVAVLGGRGQLTHPIRTLIQLALLFSIPAMAAGYVTVGWRLNDPHLSKLASMYLAYVPAMYFFLLVVSLSNGTGDFGRFNLTRLCFYAINGALVFIIWATSPVILPLLDSVVLANLAAVYGVLAVAVWVIRDFKRPANGSIVSESQGDVRAVVGLALVFALPVMLSQFTSSAYQILVEHFLGAGSLGFFVVYFSYSRLISPIGSAAAVHVFHLGIAGAQRDVSRVFRLSLLVYLGAALPLWLFAGWVIPLIFGQAFLVENSTVGALFMSCVMSLLADSMAEYLNGQRKVSADIVGRTTYLVAFGGLGAWMAPRYGLLGAAAAMAAGDTLRCSYLVKRVSRETGKPVGDFWGVIWQDVFTLLSMVKTAFQSPFA